MSKGETLSARPVLQQVMVPQLVAPPISLNDAGTITIVSPDGEIEWAPALPVSSPIAFEAKPYDPPIVFDGVI